MRTLVVQPEDAKRGWWVVSAKGQVLGRLATRVAHILRGKHKPEFAPHLDWGDHVIITDCGKVVLTGDKLAQKKYYSHSGYPGHLKEANARLMLEKHPEKVIRHAVKGMLPHNRLGRRMARKLKVYVGSDHPHEAQRPKPLQVES